MTWLTDLIEKAKKATKGPYTGEYPRRIVGINSIEVAQTWYRDDQEFIKAAYPQRIIAMAEVVEALMEVNRTTSVLAPRLFGKQGWRKLQDALTRLEELEEK